MRKIKDLIYNTSDILVVLLIILVALGIIGWRVDVIMTESGGEDAGMFRSVAVKAVTMVEDLTGKDFAFNDDAKKDVVTDVPDETDQPDETQTPDESQTQQPPTSFMLIVSEGDTAQVIAEKLKNIGAITDTTYFENLINTSGKPINPGAYTILAGKTPEGILEDITE